MTSNVQPLPTLPPEINDRSAWYGRELVRQSDWIEQLSETEIAEVDGATKKLLADPSADLTSLNTDDFPLPTLGPRLLGPLDEVLNGRGFVLIRALATLPEVFAERFGSVTPGDRGGITIAGSRPGIPFDEAHRSIV